MPTGRDVLAKGRLGFAIVPVLMVIVMGLLFKPNATEQFQFTEASRGSARFGVSYSVGVDGIALVLIAMSVILVPDRADRRLERGVTIHSPALPSRATSR